MKTTFILTALLFTSISTMAESVDLNKSSFIWRGSKITGNSHSGSIKMKKATLKNGKGEFVADMNTIDDTTLKGEWKQKFLGHIKSGDFFDVQKYPTAKLKLFLLKKVSKKDSHHIKESQYY